MTKPTIQDIENAIACDSTNCSKDIIIDKVVALSEIESAVRAISWCSDKNVELLQSISTSNVIVVGKAAIPFLQTSANYIIVDNPRRALQKILKNFFLKPKKGGIDKSATIDDSVTIGEGACIAQNVVIEENCVIGKETSIHSNTIILANTIIGDHVTIGSNSTIGGVGFGYEKNEDNQFELIPHIGNVVIHNSVHIGNNVCIDRAVLGSTRVRENVKIDNLVHIAHGVDIGRNSVVIANSMIGGSVTIGKNVWIAPSASILNKLSVGDNALVGLGAVVVKNVDSNTVVAGNPAKAIRKI